MDYKITGYEPAQLFHFFEEVSAIPRGSGNEKGISDFLVAFAKERGLDAYQDEVYNVIIRKPASAGAENAPTVMLQGHIDMVCDKLGSVEHDFMTDGIDLVVKDGVLTANGTTLGADNGIAVALMLTVLDDDSIVHPALECVFTTDEETGLVGAETLDKSQISAHTMINLDSEEEGVATVSCLERGNGNLIMARIIDRLMVAGEPAIVSFNGGTKDNAINRECKAVLAYADHAAAEAAAEIAKGIIADVTAELEVFDPGFTCTVEIADDAEVEAMDQKSALALIRALRLAPNGVIRRNVATDGSVEVSSNIGVVATSDDEVKIMLSPRSSITSLHNEFKDRLQTLADVLGFDAKFEFEYPGWSYAEHSPVRDVFIESYRELFGSELRIESIHAGLECGLFAEALHGLDAIAVGPTLSDVHTPDESMGLASAERFYELLIDVLKRLAA